MANEELFKVRWRGKVSGPFGLAELQAMLANNDISLAHEVLCDQRWISLEELLQGRRSLQSDAAVQETVVSESSVKIDEITRGSMPPPPPPEDEFYIAKNGQQQGPYTKSVVRQMAAAGIFQREDLVWKQGFPAWMELGKFMPDLPRPMQSVTVGQIPVQPVKERAVHVEENFVPLFIGNNKEYYLTKWQRAEEGSRKYSWNWAAFFLGIGWMAYRKMYKNAWLVLLGLTLLRACEIGFQLPDNRMLVVWSALPFAWGLWANYMYKQHVDRKVEQILATTPSADAARLQLVCDGHTNAWAGVGLFFLLGLLMSFMEVVQQQVAHSALADRLGM